MNPSDLLALLGQQGDEEFFAPKLAELGTVTSPGLDEDEPEQHYDWVLIPRCGLEVGFVDAAYFSGRARALWRTEGLFLQQITFYNEGREGVRAYAGELPYGLQWTDRRAQARAKLAAYASSCQSYRTDRWDVGPLRVVLDYKEGDGVLDSVHIKLRIPALPALPGGQVQLSPGQWLDLFGRPSESERLQSALAPLDLRALLDEDEEEGDREVDALQEAGLMLYFAPADCLQLPLATGDDTLVLGAVKFFRARDLEARQYAGVLPFGLKFDDNPVVLDERIGRAPDTRRDGRTTGYARWHLAHCSLQVLYSTVENHLFRVMLMAPGYFQEMASVD
jgi:hypothetical protein